MAVEGWILPVTDDPVDQRFWAAARRHALEIQRCDICAKSYFPPRIHCPVCHQLLTWVEASGKGRIWSLVTVHPPLLPAYQAVAPYHVVLVELEDHPGVRLVGNLLDVEDGAINASVDTQVQIGDPVEVVFRHVADDVALPCWKRI